jgi:hypothetical protein
VITNTGWGDVDQLVRKDRGGVLVQDLTRDAYSSSVQELDEVLDVDPAVIRDYASERFSLEKGVEEYARIYDKLKNR